MTGLMFLLSLCCAFPRNSQSLNTPSPPSYGPRIKQGGDTKHPNVSVLVASIGTGAPMVVDRIRISRLIWYSNVPDEFNIQEIWRGTYRSWPLWGERS